PTILDLWQASDVVIEGTVVARRPGPLAGGGDRQPEVLLFDVHATEVYKEKSNVKVPSTVQVRLLYRPTNIETGAQTEQQGNARLFDVGGTYVLFLRRSGDGYAETTGGPDSAFRLTESAVTTGGKSRL